MTTKKLMTASVVALMAATPVMADLVFPSLSYRTGPFAAGGIAFADGYADYFTLLNERDGGIGGVMASVPECETAYNAEKGVECYEATKAEGALVYQPLATSITYQLIPKVEVDGIPLHTMGYGRTSAKNGEVFRHTFNYPVNYWDGASAGVNHFLDLNDGSLEGRKITLLHFNGAYGKEPIPTLEALAEKHGFELTTIAIDYPGQEQKSQWLQIRRERPDYILFWGWGVMNQVAVQEAANIGYPMENFMGIWWSGSENDVLPAGAAADGYKALAFHEMGSDFPVFDDIQTYVVDAGKAAGAGDQIGSVLYNRGLYAAFLAAEAAADAQEATGEPEITAAMMRDAMESLEITAQDMEDAGIPGFGPVFSVTCQNHGGDGLASVAQWDATAQEWSLISDFFPSDGEVVNALIKADSEAFAAENDITPSCD
ncbi:branched-chain amino acid transport system substrate-binding protein [Loktanella ponticola]|uniref:Branched-chain amino acid transport system substrate-binding protein n=1 Tax=Yoonia ponticola TaxID=1524255 RepID=A0A7W9BIF2_9RHOB|nr:ABC transporter substrate-binding protein [Yoonia ponticola]MBB5721080.1 branched-chain amino acid transport system substrate-binding protein [Yoonia ponticola]